MSKLTLTGLLFLAGGLGAASRFGLATLLGRFFDKGTPWATTVINVLGCFAFGLIATLFADRARWSPELKTFATTGFLGAFTTFSTYAFELHSAATTGLWGRAVGGFLAQNVFGLAAVALGVCVARRVFPC